MIDYTLLYIGLFYATVLPGFVVTELFLPHLPFWKKLPLYLILSVIISCFFSYFAALIFGFNRGTLIGCFLVFLIPFVYILLKKKINLGRDLRKNWKIVLVGILIYTIYFVALYPAIFRLHNGYFVMGGPNWQDTAMHLSIIQSLTQGNFPPMAPYFSGAPLNYYYFSDLHAAIVNTFFGKFFPGILILLNPFLAMTFFFSVFALSYEVTKKKVFSFISGVAAVLYGNFGFLNLIRDLLAGKGSYITLITSNSYNSDQSYLQMTPMADYFLQNRPTMVGLSAFVLVILLLLTNKSNDRKYGLKILIAGIITASLIKFQMFGFLVSWIFFGIYFALKFLFRKVKFKCVIKYLLVFGIPSLITGLMLVTSRVEGRSFVKIFLDSFSWGAWQKHDILWFIDFLLGNLGIGLIIYINGFFTKKTFKNIEVLSIYLTSFVLITIPLIIRFTIYPGDMLKFFYFSIPLICVLLAYLYAKSRYKKLSILLFLIITVISSLTSINMLVHSYLNKTEGYTHPDYEAGIWIMGNTPQKSVFVTMPTVHSAPTDIGGRLRVISYINWPYSHGFNASADNVFSRVKDVESVYKTGDIGTAKLKYGAKYVFYGADERGHFPVADKLFDKNKELKLVYNQDGIKIYEIL